MSHLSLHTRSARQQGIALVVVMVVLLLSCLAVLSATRLGWLNERMVGAETDYQRAFSAAEALIRDAESDIDGWRAESAPGCASHPSSCRGFGADQPFFPRDKHDLDVLALLLKSAGTLCLRGICLPTAVHTMDEAQWNRQFASLAAGNGDTSPAARYGEFTGVDPESAGNPLLNWSRSGAATEVATRAGYWVEVFWYSHAADAMAVPSHDLAPALDHPFVYRITAYVQGVRPGTRVWLRSVYVPRPQSSTELQ